MTDAPVPGVFDRRPPQQITWTLGEPPSQQSGQVDALTGIASSLLQIASSVRQIAREHEADLLARDMRNAYDVRRLVCGVYLGKL
jgi:hypothetical protein